MASQQLCPRQAYEAVYELSDTCRTKVLGTSLRGLMGLLHGALLHTPVTQKCNEKEKLQL
jgi:hypothetical protein